MDEPSTPATKADLLEIMHGFESRMDGFESLIEKRIGGLESQLHGLEQRMDQRFRDLSDELMRHVELLDENMRRDVFGVFGDRYQSLREVQSAHGQRLNKIEAALKL